MAPFPKDLHDYENLLVEDLLKIHIPTRRHSEYYTLVIGLRFRVFEGVVTNFLTCKEISFPPRGGLREKLQKTTRAVSLLEQTWQYNQLIGCLPNLRNGILHGDFEIKISEEVYSKLNHFLFFVENCLNSAVDNAPLDIDFDEAKALSLKSKIETLIVTSDK